MKQNSFRVFDGHVVNLKELQKYQQPNPEKT